MTSALHLRPNSFGNGLPKALSGPAALPRRLRSHTVVMGTIFAAAIGVGVLLLPGINERIAMLEQDGHKLQAMAMLERSFDGGDRSQRTLFQLYRLYESAGEIKKAGRVLEMLAEQRPKDPQIQRQLAQFYKQTQNEAGYISALEHQLGVRYSEPACKELIGLFRGKGDFASEQRMINRCRGLGYRRTDDIIRLAYMVAADGRLAEAATLLRSVDERRRLRIEQDRRLFFAALIEDGRTEEAQRRALRWLKGTKDTGFALELINSLVDDKKYDLAISLAREIGSPGDPISLSVAELMLDLDQEVAARTYLRGWLAASRLADVDLAHRFIGAALDADDPELAYRGSQKVGLGKLGQRELAALAEALSALNLRPQFEEVRKAITIETIRENPLLAAAIEFERGATEPARQLLSQVQVDGLDEWRLALWARLMETTGRRAIMPPAAVRAARPVPTVAPGLPERNLKRLRDARERRAQQRRQRARVAPNAPPPATLPPGSIQ